VQAVDYISICSPNYLHDAHIRFALRYGAEVICEKPVVLNPWNIEGLEEIESTLPNKVNNIMQLRLHQSIIELKQFVDSKNTDHVFEVDLTYITSRGKWYYASWKGDESKSGGVATNIGIHFFDMLRWIFGEVKDNIVNVHCHDRAAGILKMQRANVRWFLSINYDTMPQLVKDNGQRTYRSVEVDGEEIEFSEGFPDLHTKSYQEILEGKGFGLNQTKAAIHMVHQIRSNEVVGLQGNYHPLAQLDSSPHPFK